MQVVTIGRLPDNTIMLGDDPQVSRHHAQLSNDNGQYYITDLNSTNGTYVNGNLVRGTRKLQMRDVVRLGNTTIPWLMYFDPGYIKRLNSQRAKSSNGGKPDPVGGAVYVDPRGQVNPLDDGGSNGMALAGFIFSFIFPVLGIIFSAVGIGNANKRPDKKGQGLAVAGLIISILNLLIAFIIIAI